MEVMDMPSVSNMAKDLVGSEIIRLAAQINEKIKNGQSIYNLTIVYQRLATSEGTFDDDDELSVDCWIWRGSEVCSVTTTETLGITP